LAGARLTVALPGLGSVASTRGSYLRKPRRSRTTCGVCQWKGTLASLGIAGACTAGPDPAPGLGSEAPAGFACPTTVSESTTASARMVTSADRTTDVRT